MFRVDRQVAHARQQHVGIDHSLGEQRCYEGSIRPVDRLNVDLDRRAQSGWGLRILSEKCLRPEDEEIRVASYVARNPNRVLELVAPAPWIGGIRRSVRGPRELHPDRGTPHDG